MRAQGSILKRQNRTRKALRNSTMPRISVFRSNKMLSAQIIDDNRKETLIGLSEKNLKAGGTKLERAKALGLELASQAKSKKITKAVFDRGRYSYHGRVKAFAEALREGGIKI